MHCNIKEKRKAAGLTQIEFAEKIGVVQPTVAMWETGQATPMTPKLPLIAEILGCTIDDLFGRAESEVKQ